MRGARLAILLKGRDHRGIKRLVVSTDEGLCLPHRETRKMNPFPRRNSYKKYSGQGALFRHFDHVEKCQRKGGKGGTFCSIEGTIERRQKGVVTI